MIISARLGLSITLCTLTCFAGLLGFFYFTETDSGAFPSVPTRTVLGQAVHRFTLARDEIVIASQKGGVDARDTALLIEDKEHQNRKIYIVSEKGLLLFEQSIDISFRTLVWSAERKMFIASSKDGTVLDIAKEDDAYTMIPQ